MEMNNDNKSNFYITNNGGCDFYESQKDMDLGIKMKFEEPNKTCDCNKSVNGVCDDTIWSCEICNPEFFKGRK